MCDDCDHLRKSASGLEELDDGEEQILERVCAVFFREYAVPKRKHAVISNVQMLECIDIRLCFTSVEMLLSESARKDEKIFGVSQCLCSCFNVLNEGSMFRRLPYQKSQVKGFTIRGVLPCPSSDSISGTTADSMHLHCQHRYTRSVFQAFAGDEKHLPVSTPFMLYVSVNTELAAT